MRRECGVKMEHFQPAELLYQHGADVDVLGGQKQTLLYAVSVTRLTYA